MTAFTRLKTVHALGWRSVRRVARYRIGLKTGLAPVLRLKADPPTGPFFISAHLASAPAAASTEWDQEGRLFGHHLIALDPGGAPPRFNVDPRNSVVWRGHDQQWWNVPDFGEADVKLVWELSRFPWLLPMAQRARAGATHEIGRINAWLHAWLEDNPPYLGPNWKCGQEAALRVLILAFAARLLGQLESPQAALIRLIELHLARISPTMGYALGQDNNHGTSEAAALFVGGSWLERLGHPRGASWARAGRHYLDERARTIILPDGTFSQYSLVYHRLMLDTYALAELWRRSVGLPTFAGATRDRLRLASAWFRQMLDCRSGDGPNLGANDGARLLILSDADYRDFRPSAARAAALFEGRSAFTKAADAMAELAWLEIERPQADTDAPVSVDYSAGGFAMLRDGAARALLRYPRFLFRPSQSDALHLDFWLGSRNLIRDAGSYSYYDPGGAAFAGTGAHSTVQFDGRDQMPRLSRFLFGDWLRTDDLQPLKEGQGISFAAGYRDNVGARHRRRVILMPGKLVVEDEVSGFAREAVLRWRLDNARWSADNGHVTDGQIDLGVTFEGNPASIVLATGEESRYYLDKHTIPVAEIVAHRAGRFVTTLTWPA